MVISKAGALADEVRDIMFISTGWIGEFYRSLT